MCEHPRYFSPNCLLIHSETYAKRGNSQELVEDHPSSFRRHQVQLRHLYLPSVRFRAPVYLLLTPLPWICAWLTVRALLFECSGPRRRSRTLLSPRRTRGSKPLDCPHRSRGSRCPLRYARGAVGTQDRPAKRASHDGRPTRGGPQRKRPSSRASESKGQAHG